MRKRHAASEVAWLSLCGHEATPQEYENMRKCKLERVNCQRCLGLMK